MKTKKHLNVAWADQSWPVGIRQVPRACGLAREIVRLVRSRFEPTALPPNTFPFFALEKSNRAIPTNSRPRPRGFTLVELLVVIGVIAILAGITLPVLAKVKTRAKVAQARTEMQGLAASIKQYENDYNRYPASQLTETASANTDFTFGTSGLSLPFTVVNGPPITTETNNSELVMILLDIDAGVNTDHRRNPRKNKYWNAKMVSSDVGGVSSVDYVARDPFGMPYIVTLDMNDDNKCLDAVYSKVAVSERAPTDNVGFYGLSRTAPNQPFLLNGPVMIWSWGPDKQFSDQDKANAGLNSDNILSWAN